MNYTAVGGHGLIDLKIVENLEKAVFPHF